MVAATDDEVGQVRFGIVGDPRMMIILAGVLTSKTSSSLTGFVCLLHLLSCSQLTVESKGGPWREATMSSQNLRLLARSWVTASTALISLPRLATLVLQSRLSRIALSIL